MKKKMLCMFWPFCLTLCLITGCGKEEASANDSSQAEEVVLDNAEEGSEAEAADPEESPVGENEDEVIAIGNPWADTTPAELADLMIYFRVPMEAKDVHYLYNEVGKMADCSFRLEDTTYQYRIAYTEEFEDVSGLYYDWDSTEEETINGTTVYSYAATSDEEMCQLEMWYNAPLSQMHCLSVTEPDLNGLDLLGMVYQIFEETNSEDFAMEHMDEQFIVCYDARYITGSYDDASGEARFRYTYPMYNVSGENYASFMKVKDMTAEEALKQVQTEEKLEDADIIFTHFGADGVDSYVIAGQPVEQAGRNTVTSYIAVPINDDVILIKTFRTMEEDEKLDMLIDSAFGNMMATFVLK